MPIEHIDYEERAYGTSIGFFLPSTVKFSEF